MFFLLIPLLCYIIIILLPITQLIMRIYLHLCQLLILIHPFRAISFSYLCLQLHNHIFLLLDVLLLLLLLKIYVLNIFQFLLLLTYEIMSVLTILNAYKQSLPLPLLNRNLYLFMLHRNPFLYHLTRPLYHLIPFQPHMYLSIAPSLLQTFLLQTYKLLT